MRTSQYLLSTLKFVSSDTDIISYQLMLRAGMIRKLSSGLYTWLPTGLRVLKKIENIIRNEMNNIGAIEIAMPMIQPIDLWQQSGRLKQCGLELIRFSNRNNHQFILAPTHEEAVTNLICNELQSYRQLPIIFFQIQTKFRDEIRPRFGVIRSREFLMKDAYSFHVSQKSLQDTYAKIKKTYNKIFTNMGLNFCEVQADTNSIGGHISHEFHAFTRNGENRIVLSDNSDYVENIDFAETIRPIIKRYSPTENMVLVDTSNIKNNSELIERFNISLKKIVKVLLVRTKKENKYPIIALLVRGDHEFNEIKIKKLSQVANPLSFLTEEEVSATMNINSKYIGPVNISIPIIIDYDVAVMSDFIAGANINGKHYFGINWDRDVKIPEIADIRNVITGDLSPNGKGKLIIKRSIEIGHTFQLGTKYSQIIKTNLQDRKGDNLAPIMGCYGIGITRVIAAIVEQNYDQYGIIWPDNIAPFQVAILPIYRNKYQRVYDISENIYYELNSNDIEVLIYDQQEYPGIMFYNIELIGIPHIIIISDHNLNNNNIEYIYRRERKKRFYKVKDIINFLIKTIKL